DAQRVETVASGRRLLTTRRPMPQTRSMARTAAALRTTTPPPTHKLLDSHRDKTRREPPRDAAPTSSSPSRRGRWLEGPEGVPSVASLVGSSVDLAGLTP